MAAPFKFVPMDQTRRTTLGPASRGSIDLLWENAVAARHGHRITDHEGAVETLPLEVSSSGQSRRCSSPFHNDQSHQMGVVHGEVEQRHRIARKCSSRRYRARAAMAV
jgi:hypothetical protein